MTDYTLYPCPSGFYCLFGEEPHLCPAGTMRNTTGAGLPEDCPPCRGGYYCPNDTINTHGIPCPERYYCPVGAAIPTDCPSGSYCPALTEDPIICPPGYYCTDMVVNPIECLKPFYCPEGSNMTLTCPLGYQAQDHQGIRYDVTESCRICPPGSYGNHSERATCESCPAGYFCPAGTGHGDSNPCRMGSYCPIGSPIEYSCPRGYYGTRILAESRSDCTPCVAGSYSDRDFSTHCGGCGGYADSPEGSSSCSCRGKYRNFQKSDKSCICLSGYIYYDETDTVAVTISSSENCQRISDERCSTHQVRDAATRACVDPSTFDCSRKYCSSNDPYFNQDYGRFVL